MSKPCINGHRNPKRNRHYQCMACHRDRKKRVRAEHRRMNAGKKHNSRGYYLTAKGRRALQPAFFVGVNDCSASCTCGECVMRRLRKDGKLARWARADRRSSTRAAA